MRDADPDQERFVPIGLPFKLPKVKFKLCCEKEGIIPALEPSHALAYVTKIAPKLPQNHIMIMNMCGRGDKDIFTVAEYLGFDLKN